MADFEMILYGKPEPAGSKTAFPIRNKAGDFVGNSVADANPNAADWKKAVAQAAGQIMEADGRALMSEPLSATFSFTVPRPRGHLRKDGSPRPKARAYPSVRPDVLKLARAVEDAMKGVVYHDDAQIVDERIRKQYGERAMLRVRLWRLSPTVEEAEANEGMVPL